MSIQQVHIHQRDDGQTEALAPDQTGEPTASIEATDPDRDVVDEKPAAERASKRPAAGKEMSKQDAVIARLKSPRGVSVSKLMEITGWQKHTIRGFLSAVVRKKLAFDLMSDSGRDGERRYRIVRPAREAAR